ncbi:MAG TPA: hypothetical protein VKA01_00960, partial [Vicinamibacteria bacterium]|nr:hypothetical protein [Vicinamibacteria bacterium]
KLELIAQCRDRNFSIPEIDAFVAERLASAREALSKARTEGTMPRRTLRVHDRTIQLAEEAERTRHDRLMNPLRMRALEVAAELAERTVENEKAPPSPRALGLKRSHDEVCADAFVETPAGAARGRSVRGARHERGGLEHSDVDSLPEWLKDQTAVELERTLQTSSRRIGRRHTLRRIAVHGGGLRPRPIAVPSLTADR